MGQTAIAADGQITGGGTTILKHQTRKVHWLVSGEVLCGYDGPGGDALVLREELRSVLHQRPLREACREFVRRWRVDRQLQLLRAQFVVADRESLVGITEDGTWFEPDDGIVALGPGGQAAMAAARELALHTAFTPEEIAREAMRIASEICVFTNDRLVVETL